MSNRNYSYEPLSHKKLANKNCSGREWENAKNITTRIYTKNNITTRIYRKKNTRAYLFYNKPMQAEEH